MLRQLLYKFAKHKQQNVSRKSGQNKNDHQKIVIIILMVLIIWVAKADFNQLAVSRASISGFWERQLNSCYQSLLSGMLPQVFNEATKVSAVTEVSAATEGENAIGAAETLEQQPAGIQFVSWSNVPWLLLSASLPQVFGRDTAKTVLAEQQAEQKAAETARAAQKAQEEEAKAAAALAKANKTTVAIYCTHTGESYKLSSGKQRAAAGKAGDVLTAALALADELEKQGIGAVVSEKVHDKSYNESYAKSQKTIKQLVEDHPDLEMVIDLHRDALGDDVREVIKVDKTNCAELLFIVGTDERSEHPDWRQNYALAEELDACLNELYPGVSKGLRTRAGTYNQEYHQGALLIELGSVGNSLADALQATEVLAEAIARVLDKKK